MCKSSFPKIIKVALNIAYSNGMINRECTEEHFMREVVRIISNKSIFELTELEFVLSKKTNSQLGVIADGEHREMQDLLSDCTDIIFANTLFEDFFEIE